MAKNEGTMGFSEADNLWREYAEIADKAMLPIPGTPIDPNWRPRMDLLPDWQPITVGGYTTKISANTPYSTLAPFMSRRAQPQGFDPMALLQQLSNMYAQQYGVQNPIYGAGLLDPKFLGALGQKY